MMKNRHGVVWQALLAILGMMVLAMTTASLAAAEWTYTWAGGSDPVPTASVCSLLYGKTWAYAVEIDDNPISIQTFSVDFVGNNKYTDAPPGVSGGNDRPFVGNAAVCIKWIGANNTYLDEAGIADIISRGWGVANHSFNHRGQTWDPVEILTAAEMREDLFWSESFLGHVFRNNRAPTHFIYPNGYTDYKNHFAEFGMVSGSRVGGWGRNLTATNKVEFSRTYLDEGAWVGAGGAAMYDFPTPPAADDFIIDFTHSMDSNPGSANYQRWQTRLQTIASTYGKGGADTLWSAPVEEVMSYAISRSQATVTPATGQIQVTLPDDAPGTRLTIKLENIPPGTSMTAPTGGLLYRQGTTAWVTSPLIGNRGADMPTPRVARDYTGTVGRHNYASPVLLGGVIVHYSGDPGGQTEVRVDYYDSNNVKQYLTSKNLPTGWGNGMLLIPVLPLGTPPLVRGVEVSGASTITTMEIWLQDDAVPTTLTMAVSPGGSGTTSPAVGAHTVNVDDATPISATALTGYAFANWTASGNASFGDANSADTTVTITDAAGATVTANFDSVPTATLTLAVSPAGAGTTSPAIGGHTVNIGTATSIGTTPTVGKMFVNWTVTAGSATLGDANSANTTATLTSGNATVTANFTDAPTATLTLAVAPDGTGTTNPAVGAHSVTVGTPEAIAATPGADKIFVNWTVTAGNATIANANAASTTATVTAIGGATVTANFADAPSEDILIPAAAGQATGSGYFLMENAFDAQPTWDDNAKTPVGGVGSPTDENAPVAWGNDRYGCIDFGPYWNQVRITGTWTRYRQYSEGNQSAYQEVWWDNNNGIAKADFVSEATLNFNSKPSLVNTGSTEPWVQDANCGASPITPARRYLILHAAYPMTDRAKEYALTGYVFSPLTMAANPGGGGTLTPTDGEHPTQKVGRVIPITATPSAGYAFVNWTVTTGNATLADADSASTSVTLNDGGGATITANFESVGEPATLTLAVAPGGSGTTNPAVGGHAVTVGVATAISATPAVGKQFTNWTVTAGNATLGNANLASTTATVSDTGGATVTANFDSATYTLTYTAGAGGSVVGDSPQTVEYGQDGTEVVATPALHYHFVDWSDGVLTAARTDTNITADITVTANFSIDTYTVTFDLDGKGTRTGGGALVQQVGHGSAATAPTVVGSAGWVFTGWDVAFDNITAPLTVTALYDVATFTLTYTAGAGGSVSGDSPQTVEYGQDGTEVVATPALHYHFVDWSDGVLTAARTDTNVTADITVTANFSIDTYTVTFDLDGKGTRTGGGALVQQVGHGSAATAPTVVGSAGWVFTGWDATFDNITGPLTVTALYDVATYTLTYTAGAGGSVSGDSPQTVEYGQDGTEVVATPDEGMHFVDWSDGILTAARTDTNVTADITVTANFTANLEQVAIGSVFDVSADEVGATGPFIRKPKIYAVYTDPVKHTPGKMAGSKILTKVSAKTPMEIVDCQWIKKIRLFDAKQLTIAHKLGSTTDTWLSGNPDPQPLLAMALFLSSKDISLVPVAVGTLHLSPPEIASVTVEAMTITVDGQWFGTKKPKVWLEYVLPGVGVKMIKCKVLAPSGDFLDAKGKAVYMNPATGDSALTLQRPTKLPKGLADWPDITHLVVDNGAGLGSEAIDWNP